MPKLVVSVPTAEVRITENGSLKDIKEKFGVSDDDFISMGLAELGARLSGAVKRAIAGKKLPPKPTDAEVRDFIASWDGLGGRKGTPLTRYNSMVKAGTYTKKELDQAADEAADFILSQKSSNVRTAEAASA
jgi:hypothetical protein